MKDTTIKLGVKKLVNSLNGNGCAIGYSSITNIAQQFVLLHIRLARLDHEIAT